MGRRSRAGFTAVVLLCGSAPHQHDIPRIPAPGSAAAAAPAAGCQWLSAVPRCHLPTALAEPSQTLDLLVDDDVAIVMQSISTPLALDAKRGRRAWTLSGGSRRRRWRAESEAGPSSSLEPAAHMHSSEELSPIQKCILCAFQGELHAACSCSASSASRSQHWLMPLQHTACCFNTIVSGQRQ